MRSRPEIQVGHTADLAPPVLAAARELVYLAFAYDVTEQDWEHALGGIHALAWEGNELVGHASVVQRRLLHAGRALRAGYIEGVAVHPGRRRHGIGGMLMEPLERIVRNAYELGALGASDEGAHLYSARGWTLWRGPTAAMTPNGIVPTPGDDGSVYVLEVAVALDPDGELTCDWREGELW
jgi:aminoglycoside 2'-N-acetyltransferase I